jgi:beta-glucosidase
MTLEQKIAQLHGAMETIDIYALAAQAAESGADMDQLATQIRVERHVTAIDELGIPRFRITNGPVGVGMGDGTPSPPATSLPMTIGLAAGFDPDLAHSYGNIIGSETATLGQHVLEGPGVCLHRTTIAGRNFEYFSEDPYLSGVVGVAVTRAIQAHDVIAMGKHYVVNDQEYERFRTNIEVDEHVLRELYLLPFEMLVKDADIAAIMSSYNRVRGVYATEYRYTLTDILRTEWGFDGYVQSDFWSCRSAAPSLNAGMDHEMPDAKWLNEGTVKAALRDTSLEIETVDRALIRRYTQMFRFGQFQRPYQPGEIDAQAHGAISRTIGSQIARPAKERRWRATTHCEYRVRRRHRPVQVRRRSVPRRRRLIQGDPAVHGEPDGRHAGRTQGPRLVRHREQGDRHRRSVQPGRGQKSGQTGRSGGADGRPGRDRGR